MKTPLPNDLLEATRLTRAGRLAEATAMLQRALGVQAAPGGADPEERRGPPTIDGVAEAGGTAGGGSAPRAEPPPAARAGRPGPPALGPPGRNGAGRAGPPP